NSASAGVRAPSPAPSVVVRPKPSSAIVVGSSPANGGRSVVVPGGLKVPLARAMPNATTTVTPCACPGVRATPVIAAASPAYAKDTASASAATDAAGPHPPPKASCIVAAVTSNDVHPTARAAI